MAFTKFLVTFYQSSNTRIAKNKRLTSILTTIYL